MKTVVILSYNNLGLDFWNRHLNLENTADIHHFRSGKACIGALTIGLNPDLILIDDYFARVEVGDFTGSQMVKKIAKKRPDIPCFHITPDSPKVGSTKTGTRVIHSNFGEDVLSLINESIGSQLVQTI